MKNKLLFSQLNKSRFKLLLIFFLSLLLFLFSRNILFSQIVPTSSELNFKKIYNDYREQKISQQAIRQHIQQHQNRKNYLIALLLSLWEKATIDQDSELKLLLITSYYNLKYYELIANLNLQGCNYAIYNYYLRSLFHINDENILAKWATYLLETKSIAYNSQNQYEYLFKEILQKYSWQEIVAKIENLPIWQNNSPKILQKNIEAKQLILVFFAYHDKKILPLQKALLEYYRLTSSVSSSKNKEEKLIVTLVERYFKQKIKKILTTFVEYDFEYKKLLRLFNLEKEQKNWQKILQAFFLEKKYKQVILVAQKNKMFANFYYQYALFQEKYQQIKPTTTFLKTISQFNLIHLTNFKPHADKNTYEPYFYYWLQLIEKQNTKTLLEYYRLIDIKKLNSIQLLTFDWILEFQNHQNLKTILEYVFKIVVNDPTGYEQLYNEELNAKISSLPESFFEYLIHHGFSFYYHTGNNKALEILYQRYKNKMNNPFHQETLYYYYAKSKLFSDTAKAIGFLKEILYHNSKTPYRLQIERDLKYFSF